MSSIERLSALNPFDLGDGVEAWDREDFPKGSFIRAYGSDTDTNGEVVFEITDQTSFSDGQHVARVSIPKRVALEWAAIIAGECAKGSY